MQNKNFLINESKKSKVLALFNLLIKNEFDKKSIISILNIKETSFFKILNILKKAGFTIIKNKNKYRIAFFSDNFLFKNIETSSIANMMLLAFIYLPYSRFKDFSSAINNLTNIINKEEYFGIISKFEKYKFKYEKNNFSKKIEILEEYLNKNEKLKIITNRKEEIIILPLNFMWKKDKFSLFALNIETDEKITIPFDKIVKIIPTNEIEIYKKQETIFELYGKLAKKYLLKDEEGVIDWTNDKIIICNSSSDKEALFKRLLRYDSLCKIVSPQKDVIKFKKIIEKALDNIE